MKDLPLTLGNRFWYCCYIPDAGRQIPFTINYKVHWFFSQDGFASPERGPHRGEPISPNQFRVPWRRKRWREVRGGRSGHPFLWVSTEMGKFDSQKSTPLKTNKCPLKRWPFQVKFHPSKTPCIFGPFIVAPNHSQKYPFFVAMPSRSGTWW